MVSHKDTPLSGGSSVAFLPFTFGGIARFGSARRKFIFSVETVVALFCALCVLWVFYTSYFPVMDKAVKMLPTSVVGIKGGSLVWVDEPDGILAQGTRLAVVINAYGRAGMGRDADVVFELGRRGIRLVSCHYYMDIPYGMGDFSLNRDRVIPWWKVWKGSVIFWVLLLSGCSLFVVWQVLSFFYMFVVRFIVFLKKRNVKWEGCYSLAGAALMPGAVLMGLGLLGYGAGFYGLTVLGGVFVAHLILGWFYLIVASLIVSGRPRELGAGDNPFNRPLPPPMSSPFKKKNPFSE